MLVPIWSNYFSGPKYYSTVDHIFTLLAIVQKLLSLNRKRYVAFVDCEKAFASIWNYLLWTIMKKIGVSGKLFYCVKMHVWECYGTSQRWSMINRLCWILTWCKARWCLQSSPLFIVYNELTLDIINGGKHSALLTPTLVELFVLMFADGIVLLSETVIGLQNQLNILHQSANKL